MVMIRRANSYTKIYVRPYTRHSRKKNKAYIKVIPPQKIVKFTMGTTSLLKEKKLPHKLILLADEKCQIRHNALEAARQYINKKLDTELVNQYVFKVLPYPHHIQRENRMIMGAGADRLQTGMQLSFGQCMGKAALVKKGTKIFEAYLPTEKAVAYMRKVYQEVGPKLPCRKKAVYEKVE